MALPIYHTQDRSFSLMQTNWSSQINPVISNPIVNGSLLTNVLLAHSASNVINHKLGRKLQGYIVVGKNAAAEIFDEQASNQTPQLTLVLNSNAACTVNLWVF